MPCFIRPFTFDIRAIAVVSDGNIPKTRAGKYHTETESPLFINAALSTVTVTDIEPVNRYEAKPRIYRHTSEPVHGTSRESIKTWRTVSERCIKRRHHSTRGSYWDRIMCARLYSANIFFRDIRAYNSL